jgi:hypothetical protein
VVPFERRSGVTVSSGAVTILGRGDLAPPRRYRRRRLPRALLALVVLGAVGYGVWYAYDRWIDDGGEASDTLATPCVTPSHPPAPAAAKDVTVWVLNSTKRVGLAHDVAKALRARGFRVGGVGNAGHAALAHTVVNYRSGQLPEALVVGEHAGEVQLTDGSKRLELVIGKDFRGLASLQAVAAARAADVRAANPPPPACAGSEAPA